ncbi:uncharacterized protein LOC127792657 isoform X2 [Diospyros lotus]|uniref:uncharacterized protein LOC127792657 isoform X2 n=1 Tax=Diospyros lotus TaxID=55363 RepID=UPI0022587D2E|nr:uncharacterized protein LOC127792657 isoform X2 [Diospyros lotus]
MLLSSLRSHFFKHLPGATSLAIRRVHRRLSPASRFGFLLPSPFAGVRNPWDPRNSVTAARLSAAAFPDTPAPCSFTSPYLSVHIQCPKDVADTLSEALLCFGASSTSMDVSENVHDVDLDECISHAANSIGLNGTPSYKVIKCDQSDWIKQSQDSFHPVEITEGLWVVPEWRAPPNLQATNIILNPGLAFGTGDHPTTKLCLLLLRGLIKGGELFLDYGAGSGILAIAAIKFGAALSVGFDIDPQAIRSARYNASLNNIGAEKLQLQLVFGKKSHPTADKTTNGGVDTQNGTRLISETEKYDVVIANILLNPLLDLADDIISYAKPGAIVGVSGIISEQVPCIVEQYSRYLEGISVTMMNDWACISGTKKRSGSTWKVSSQQLLAEEDKLC